eukprot:14548301-Ditylum_brightwellii.AAC.1
MQHNTKYPNNTVKKELDINRCTVRKPHLTKTIPEPKGKSSQIHDPTAMPTDEAHSYEDTDI